MTSTKGLERLTEHHEALTMNVEMISAISRSSARIRRGMARISGSSSER